MSNPAVMSFDWGMCIKFGEPRQKRIQLCSTFRGPNFSLIFSQLQDYPIAIPMLHFRPILKKCISETVVQITPELPLSYCRGFISVLLLSVLFINKTEVINLRI